MTIVGYARASTLEQNSRKQETALKAAGAERVFVDKGESSRKTSRPQFNACLAHLRKGDVLLVYGLDRLSSPSRHGSNAHLLTLINELGERGIDLRSLTEPAIDTTSPFGRALYGIVAVFAQLRVDTIRQNTRDGLAHARAQGRVGGRPTVMTADRIIAAVDMRANGETIDTIATTLRVGSATVKRALKKAADDRAAAKASVQVPATEEAHRATAAAE